MERVDSVSTTADPAADLAGAALDGFRPFVLDHPDLFRIAFVWGGVDLGPDVGQAAARALGRLTARIERARAAGLVPDRPVEELACEFHALCQGLAALELCATMSRADADRLCARSVGDLMAGLRARASATSTVMSDAAGGT